VSPQPDWMDRPVTDRRFRAVDYVMADLRQAMDSGVIQVGERLPAESALAARYSVSRAVVREVLRSMESRGLTLTRSGKGTFVIAARPSDLVFESYSAAHLIEARPGIEVPAAALAALRRTDEQLAELQQLVEAMEREADNAVWTRLDAEFHLDVAQASGNPVFAAVMASIAAALSGQSEFLNLQAERRRAAELEHRAILGAIARESAVEAEDAMRYHLEEVRDAVARMLTRVRS
jgi:GntR family transcriptional regulator, transcriptional repressor for pyruvate dehydrogenase complex